MLKEHFLNRFNSNRADSNSVSMLLWIVVVVVIVLTVGVIVKNALVKKGHQVGKCINDSNSVLNGTPGSCKNFSS